MKHVEKPIHRSKLRHMLGRTYYGMLRKLLWIKMNRQFAGQRQKELLTYTYFTHKTILLRKLKNVDMWMQQNKIVNLRIAAEKLDGVIVRPGEIFSYWKLIGKPSKRKGYVEGMVLRNGKVQPGIGGGLCQMSNLIFWMTIHTPLTVVERHRHGFDVFPDANRTQPFGSGATCYYPHGDLMIRNNTEDTYQLVIKVDEEYLKGEWRVTSLPQYKVEIVEKNHEMKSEYWGGFSRHNEIWQQVFDPEGNFIEERLVVKNSAVMMYSPFIDYNPEEAAVERNADE